MRPQATKHNILKRIVFTTFSASHLIATKARAPEPEQLIAMYKKGYGELRLFGGGDIDKKIARSSLETSARMGGLSEDKVAQVMALFDTGKITVAQLIKDMFRETQKTKKDEVMVIDEKDIENHLNHGWEFVGLTPSGRCIVKRSL